MERNTCEPESLRLTPRCGARKRDGSPCQKPRAKDKTRCRLHGGAAGSGAPRGKRNGRYSHGLFTTQADEERSVLSDLLRSVRPTTR
jgi:glucans biosynthesis protein